ncbi:MAG TPA: DUF1122 family protein [Actinomycetota bacterium]|nr:DUF1122 family protein [Actinomycetota bacterium]
MRFLERRPGRTAGEERVVIGDRAGRPVARGLWFHGRTAAGVRPWADLVVEDPSVLREVAAALGPGASLMVAYQGDETERALRRRVPPAATPLGLALLRAGCRWFKDWYYPEGGREGGTKLQGTLPLDESHRRRAERALAEELTAFLAAGPPEPDAGRAREALRVLGRPEPPS